MKKNFKNKKIFYFLYLQCSFKAFEVALLHFKADGHCPMENTNSGKPRKSLEKNRFPGIPGKFSSLYHLFVRTVLDSLSPWDMQYGTMSQPLYNQSYLVTTMGPCHNQFLISHIWSQPFIITHYGTMSQPLYNHTLYGTMSQPL
jgi:hypothetical protein